MRATPSIFLGENKHTVDEALKFYVESGAVVVEEYRASRQQAAEWGVEYNILVHAKLSWSGPESLIHVMSGYADPHGAVHLDFDNTPEQKKSMKSLYTYLSKGGEVLVPLSKVYWGALYAHIVDKFGITWMFNMSE